MADMPWYRFYSEAIHDPKIARIARLEQEHKCTVLGFWATLLSLASESPKRGMLLLSDGIPYESWEIAEVAGMGEQETNSLIRDFIAVNMLVETGGILCIVNWDKRQFNSDNSTARVKRFREKKRAESVTLPKRYTNVIETDTYTETDKETEKGNIYTPPQEYPDLETERKRIAVRTEIVAQVKETMWVKNEAEFNDAADAVIEMGDKPEDVKGFGAWWTVNGQYKGKPALKSFMMNYKSYRAGETLSKPSANGQHPAGKKETTAERAERIKKMAGVE